MADIVFNPLPAQRSFMNDVLTRFLYMSGGYGAGKTYALCMKILQLSSLNPGLPGGITAPNTKMLKRDVIPTFREICGENNITFRYKASDGELEFKDTGTTIYLYHGEDDGASIGGANLAFMGINEASRCSWNTAQAAFARVRLKNAPCPQIPMSGTPEEFNWVYKRFIESPIKNSRVIYGRTVDNSFIDSGYVDMLTDSYDDIAKQQYVDGLYVPKAGNRFLHKFNRFKHVTDKSVRILGADVWVNIDFNVNPMAASIMSYVPSSRVKLRVFDEIKIAGADTYELADAIKEKVGPSWREAYLFPDPAGNARKTSSRDLISDIKILKAEGFQEDRIRYKSQIVLKDTYNAANNLFDKMSVSVHPNCREFISDAEQCKLKDGAFEMNKSDSTRTHWVDGFKNMADYMFPVVKSYSEISTRRIR
jgi:hypothetical protein